MKITYLRRHLQLGLLAVSVSTLTGYLAGDTVLPKPFRGGGLDGNVPMIHIDVFYDATANEMHASLDTSHGVPHLTPLPLDYGFNADSKFGVLNGKAYNLQYAWNPGGIFAPPPGAAVWIECLGLPEGLENYDGPGNMKEDPPRPFTPIFGTEGSPAIWKWYGRMAHNAFAIRETTAKNLSATFRVYFGDETAGSREGFEQYDDDTVTLQWTVDPVAPELMFSFGAMAEGDMHRLAFLNGEAFDTGSGYFVDMQPVGSGPRADQYEGGVPMTVVAATVENGGPSEHHPELGAHVEVELVSLSGPAGAQLQLWEAGETEPRLTLPVGETAGTGRFAVSENSEGGDTDPYGCVEGRCFSVDRPGLYQLGFRLIDTSTVGAEGGPLHPPSAVHHVYLQAGNSAQAIEWHHGAVTVSFAGRAETNIRLERASSLDEQAAWEVVAGPLRGMHRLQQLTDPAPSGALMFYRLGTEAP